MFRIFRRVRDWNPLVLFGSLGVLLLLLSLFLGWSIIAEFLASGVIVRVPRLVICSFLALFGLFSIGFGLMMDYLERRLAFLS